MTGDGFHIIVGAGAIGRSVMDTLVQQGRRVRVVTRSGQRGDIPAAVEVVAGDAANLEDTRRFCAGAARVYNCTNAPYHKWREQFPPLQRGVLEGAAAAGAKLVVIENLYMYGSTNGQPIREDLPYNATGARGSTRALMARELIEAHKNGKVQVTIGRASDYFGPGAPQATIGKQAFVAALRGKTAQVVIHADQPHTYTYVPDIGRALVMLGDTDAAYGQAWHLPSPQTVTTREFLSMIYEEAGQSLRVRVMPPLLVKAFSYIIPPIRGIDELFYEFMEPFVLDSSKFISAFGDTSTPLQEAIQTTLAWFKAREMKQ